MTSTPIPPGPVSDLAFWLDELERAGMGNAIELQVIEAGRRLIRVVRGEREPDFGGPSTEDDHLAEER